MQFPRQPAKRIQVHQGDLFSITQLSNPTTGYLWQTNFKSDDKIALMGHEYEPAKVAGGVEGSGGRDRWRFKALKPGKTRFVLEYVRPWEKFKKAEIIRVYEVQVS